MSYNPSYLYSRLRDTIPAALPWSGGDPSVKGDPKKTVKWIDVCLRRVLSARFLMQELIFLSHLIGSPWDRVVLGRPHPSGTSLGL